MKQDVAYFTWICCETMVVVHGAEASRATITEFAVGSCHTEMICQSKEIGGVDGYK